MGFKKRKPRAREVVEREAHGWRLCPGWDGRGMHPHLWAPGGDARVPILEAGRYTIERETCRHHARLAVKKEGKAGT